MTMPIGASLSFSLRRPQEPREGRQADARTPPSSLSCPRAANILAKSMTIHGQPLLTHKNLEHVMQLASKHDLRAPVKQWGWDEQQVRQAFEAVERREEFKASVVVVSQQQQ